jgi:hypothetical protein
MASCSSSVFSVGRAQAVSRKVKIRKMDIIVIL